MRADFWERTDGGVDKVATLYWDGTQTHWDGLKIDMIKRILEGPFGILGDRSFDPSKDWDQLGVLISGSRLWSVVK